MHRTQGSATIKVSFNASELVTGVIGNMTDFVAKANAKELYVNLHTVKNPRGEIRGQLVPTKKN